MEEDALGAAELADLLDRLAGEFATTLIAMLFDLVAPDVKMISLASAPMSKATLARDSSTTSADSQPYACVRECGLPYICVMYGSIASSTRRSRGIVACESR